MISGILQFVRISARVDYAVRAALELAAQSPAPVKAEPLANSQGIPISFLENILSDMRRAGIVTSQRGRDGGHALARPADQITIADVMRVEIGNLAEVHGKRPEDIRYQGAAEHLTDVWVAARAAYRKVLESVTLADVLADKYPREIRNLVRTEDSWSSHWPRNR